MASFRFQKAVSFLICVCLFAVLPSVLDAQKHGGLPIAVRHWSGDAYTVETMSGLTVGMKAKSLEGKVDIHVEDLGAEGAVGVSRKANMEKWETEKLSGDAEPAKEMVVIQAGPITTVSTRPVGVHFLSKMPPSEMMKAAKMAKDDQGHSVMVAMGGNFDAAKCEKLIETFAPQILIVDKSITKVGEVEVEKVEHNTVAFSSSWKNDKKTQIISLGTEPYKMSDQLKDLFAKKEAACKDSRDMFAKLSVKQMNFKPANGTHTPRWNTEHMMGRELLFFSQIYHAVDPSIPVMDLNPKQMPKDYKFAHEDWTGAEEARQMKRVEDFTRRFAYMLDGMDLNKRAKGSRFWSPRALLAQMERHYNEHSANVVKKMKLDGWPNEEE